MRGTSPTIINLLMIILYRDRLSLKNLTRMLRKANEARFSVVSVVDPPHHVLEPKIIQTNCSCMPRQF